MSRFKSMLAPLAVAMAIFGANMSAANAATGPLDTTFKRNVAGVYFFGTTLPAQGFQDGFTSLLANSTAFEAAIAEWAQAIGASALSGPVTFNVAGTGTNNKWTEFYTFVAAPGTKTATVHNGDQSITIGVPGPIAGAGLPVLLGGIITLTAMRRKLFKSA